MEEREAKLKTVLSTTRYPEAAWVTTLRPYAEGLFRVKNFVKLCAERAPKCPLGSAYFIDNKRAPEATDRLLTEGLQVKLGFHEDEPN